MPQLEKLSPDGLTKQVWDVVYNDRDCNVMFYDYRVENRPSKRHKFPKRDYSKRTPPTPEQAQEGFNLFLSQLTFTIKPATK